jgi:putative ABC transport system permease protein
MGLVIGVTLVTTFASGLDALRRSVDSWELSPARRQEAQSWMSTMSTILVIVVLVSAVIAAFGFVSTMSLTVIHRRREIGLLRALGFTRRQIRSMIIRESAALAGSAVALGLVLGMIYGSVGAQALVGAQTAGFVWGIPWPVLGSIALASVALVLVAALAPARRAVRVMPIDALRMT